MTENPKVYLSYFLGLILKSFRQISKCAKSKKIVTGKSPFLVSVVCVCLHACDTRSFSELP